MQFFFYGTLAAPDHPVAGPLHRLLSPGRPATARGALVALPDPAGWYPAFVPAEAGGTVHGLLFAAAAAFSAADLARIDAYEDVRPGDPAGSEYRRRPVPVTCAGVTGHAHAYCYNRPLPATAEPVGDGDFAAWLVRTGRAAFRP